VASAERQPRREGKPTYRPNLSIITDQDSIDYRDLKGMSFKYRHSLLNDYSFYTRTPTERPPEGECLLKNHVLVQYVRRTHQPPAKHAVILIHGNSSIPDDFFADNGTYLNDAGTQLYAQRFDIYAPYVTHNSRFQDARRRLASLAGHSFPELDVQRIVLLIESAARDYQFLHLAGVSYGGLLAVLTYARVGESSPDTAKRIGVVLSIEGLAPAEKIIKADLRSSLFAWNWEMVFPGIGSAQFLDLAKRENVYLAFGSANKQTYEILYEDISGARKADYRVLEYDGGHEFKPEVFLQAFKSWETRRAARP
jgi:pimeloyl-ACP methyl ester carboxylesterase